MENPTSSKNRWFMGSVALFIVLGGSYLLWKKTATEWHHVSSEYALNRDLKPLAQQLSELSHTVDQLSTRISQLENPHDHTRLLNESYQTVRLVNMRLIMLADTQTAIAVLPGLEKTFQNLPTALGFRLKETLERDLDRLKNYQMVDKEGLWLKLDSLQQLVDTLPQRAIEPSPEAPTPLIQHPQGWREYLENVWLSLKKSVKIYKRQDEAALWRQEWSYEAEPYMLKAAIEQAKWAVLYTKPAIYQSSLRSLQKILDSFPQTSVAVKNFQSQLKEIADLPLQADPPNINATESALADAIAS